MLRGAIVAESLRVGTVVEMPLVVRKLERIDAGVEGQLPQWTLLWFEADAADADRLAAAWPTRSKPTVGGTRTSIRMSR